MAMKLSLALPALLLALVLLPGQAAVANQAQEQGDSGRTITKVVKLLQNMVDASKKEGDTERDLYAKYKCYCDSNEADKKAEIAKLSQEIALLESEIEEIQADTAGLSKEVQKLDEDKAANKASQDEATSIRGKENEAFVALEKDLKAAIEQMKEAIKTLSEVGADQTLSTAADHKQYMAGHEEGASLVKLKASVRQALLAANAFVSSKQATVVDAFLQAPFTGTYTAQSGQVVGILKDMLDTFEANLDAAVKTEATQKAAYLKLMKELGDAWDAMDKSYLKKQGELAANDGALESKKGQLVEAQNSKGSAEDFLEKLLDMCAAKKKQYEERVELRMNEETALSEAISILNSDAAFATFGTVDATKTGATSFVQMRRVAVRRHRAAAAQRVVADASAPTRRAAQEFLQKASSAQSSSILMRIALMLKANNPFETVLKEIEKMIDLLKEEGDKDKEHKEWCDGERGVTNNNIEKKIGEISGLNGDIDKLNNAIDNPETGLKVSIKNDEDELQTNYNNQVTQTKDRREENIAYQKDISNLVEAQSLVARAISVLRKYYAKISDQIKAEGGALLQSHRGARAQKKDEPAPPGTWEDKYKGQSEAGGTDAVSMLEFILKNTKAEETQAHTDEETDQHNYEDSMQGLKQEEKDLQKSLTKLRKELADKEMTLMQKEKDLAKTEAEKKALEDYLVSIKPGCDFITENLSLRDSNRDNEKKALEQAVGLIQGTPAYQEFEATAHNESLGDCLGICTKDEDHVDCKACLAGTSVPGYCAGHPATHGC